MTPTVYLNRKQRAVLNGCFFFRVQRCNHGRVPQGSVLGPLPFIIYIDDCVAGKILKFADHTKIYHTVY